MNNTDMEITSYFPNLHVSTVVIIEEKTMKRRPKKRLPPLLKVFEASFPAS
jgi:hypothetical protein